MSDRYLCKAKRTDNGEWIEGFYVKFYSNGDSNPNYMIFTIDEQNRSSQPYTIDPDTVCQCTGLEDKNSKLVFENDITKLILPDGEVRYFKVSFKKVIRKVLCHPDFDDDVARVELNAICFEWNGYELFPCIGEKGVSDISKMEVVGNIFDNPELLEGGAE